MNAEGIMNMKIFKVKPNENLFAIFNYINSDEYYLSYQEIIQFCLDYEYYKELYEHWHIVKPLIDQHNETHRNMRSPSISGVMIEVPEPEFDDKDDLL